MTQAILLLAAVLGQTIHLRDGLSCPTVEQLETELRALSQTDAAEVQHDIVQLTRGADRLTVALLESDGEPLAEKAIPLSQDCAALARTVAVVVTAWEADLALGGPRGALQLPRRVEAIGPATTPAETVVSPPSTPTNRFEFKLVAGLGVEGDWTSAGLAGGGRLWGALRWHRLEAEVELWGQTPHQVPFGSGVLRWERGALVLGLGYSIVERPVRLEIVPQMTGAVLGLQLAGLSLPFSEAKPDIGLGGSLRASLDVGLPVWIALTAVDWPIERSVEDPRLGVANSLPPFEVFLSVGVALDLR